MTDDLPTPTVSRVGRIAFGITALIATFGLGLNLIITARGTYPSLQTKPSIYGYDNPDGLAGVVSRVLDFASYFTILSNVVVIIVLFALWRGRIGPTPVWRALRMDSLLMITVTGLIFVIVLAPDAHLQGLQYITNTIEHYITPVLTIVTFLLWGPRRWFRLETVFAALIVPFAWVAYALARGAVIDAYPYGFLDVVTLGWGKALVNIGGVLVLGVVLGLIYLGIDRLLSRRR